MIYLTYAEIPSEKIDLNEIKELFYEVSYLDSVTERKNDASRQESLAALLLLAESFKKIGIDPSEISLDRDENGRPFVKGNKQIDFSLSHSGRFVACAVSTDGHVGVDIEKISDNDRYERIAVRFLSEAELKKAKNARDFTRVWTNKEAYYKFTGKGKLTEVDSESVTDARLESFTAEREYFISICTEKTDKVCENPQKITIK